MKKLIVFISIFLIFSACKKEAEIVEKKKIHSTAVEAKILAVGLDSNYPPYMFSEGGAKGIYTEILKNAFKKMNLSVDLKSQPWKRVMKKAKKGKWGVGGIYMNSERLKIFDYSEPIFEEKLVFYVKAGNNFKFKKLADLKGQSLALMRGWSYGEKIDQAVKKNLFTVQLVDGANQALAMLIKDRIDGVIVDELSAKIIIKKNSFGGKVKISGEPVSINKGYLVFPKKLNKKNILEKFNFTLKSMKEDGLLNKIVSKFISN